MPAYNGTWPPTVARMKGSERAFAQALSLLLQLLHLALRDTPEVEEQTAGGGRLAGVDVADDHQVDVELLFAHLVSI